MKFIKNTWEVFTRSHATIVGKYRKLLAPIFLDVVSVLLFYLLLWFIFAPRIHNALADILPIVQQMKENISVAGQVQFDTYLSTLVNVVGVFLITCMAGWSILQGYIWNKIRSVLHNTKTKNGDYIIRFGIVTFLYGIPMWVLFFVGAKLSFGLPLRQIVVLIITGCVLCIFLHFLFVTYAHVFVKKDLVNDLKKILWGGLKDGVSKFHSWFALYVLLGVFFYLVDFVLRIISDFSIPAYLIVGVALLLYGFLLSKVAVISLKHSH